MLADVEPDIVKPYHVGPGGLMDNDGQAAHAYGTEALMLVRPDGCVGLFANATESDNVAEYLRRP